MSAVCELILKSPQIWPTVSKYADSCMLNHGEVYGIRVNVSRFRGVLQKKLAEMYPNSGMEIGSYVYVVMTYSWAINGPFCEFADDISRLPKSILKPKFYDPLWMNVMNDMSMSPTRNPNELPVLIRTVCQFVCDAFVELKISGENMTATFILYEALKRKKADVDLCIGYAIDRFGRAGKCSYIRYGRICTDANYIRIDIGQMIDCVLLHDYEYMRLSINSEDREIIDMGMHDSEGFLLYYRDPVKFWESRPLVLQETRNLILST